MRLLSTTLQCSRIAIRRRGAVAIACYWLCAGGWACASPEGAEVAASAWPVIYGEDDRVEAFAVVDDDLRELAQRSAVALLPRDTAIVDDGAIELRASNLGEATNLCSGEPFVEQPTAALCSGLLIERDLVLTAGHCTHMIPCDEMQLVIGYYYQAQGVLAPLDRDDLYECSEVLASERSLPTASERLDYGWIRLDREVTDWRQRSIELRDDARPLEVHEPLTMFGFPSGTPLKVDDGGAVTDPRLDTLDYFEASTDSFYGNSGSPIFDADGSLVGIQNRGASDFMLTDDGCNALVRYPADAMDSEEQATYAFRALEGLCAREPRQRLCPGWDIVHTGGDCAVTRVGSEADRRGTAGWAALLVTLVSLSRRPKRRGRGCGRG